MISTSQTQISKKKYQRFSCFLGLCCGRQDSPPQEFETRTVIAPLTSMKHSGKNFFWG